MNKTIAIFSILFIIKISTFAFFSSYTNTNNSSLLTTIPEEDEGYLSAIENYIEHGSLFYDGKFSKDKKMYAVRVPGQNIAYYLFRSFLPRNAAINSLIIFQIFLYSIGITLMVKLIVKYIKTFSAYSIAILVFSADFYLSISNNAPYLAESIFISMTLISIFFLDRYLSSQNKFHLLLTGFFAALTFFFRVTGAIYLMILGLFLIGIFVKYQYQLKKVITLLLIFSAPFFILESIWVIRNKQVTSEIIFTQQMKGASINVLKPSTSPHYSCVNFLKSFGGDWVKWNPSSEISWFSSEIFLKKNGFERPKDNIFPDFIFNKNLTINKLKEARILMWELENTNTSANEKILKSKAACEIFDEFKRNIYKNNTLTFYVTSRLKYTYKLLFSSSTYYYPYSFSDASILEKALKIMSMLLYYFIMIVPIIFLPFYFRNYNHFKNYIVNLLYINSISNIFFYCFIFRTCQSRYNLIIYLSFMMITIYCISLFLNHILQRKKIVDI